MIMETEGNRTKSCDSIPPAVEALRSALRSLEPGPVPESRNIDVLLIRAWEEFQGSDESSMTAYKLAGRIENLTWTPPRLEFRIERHGRTMCGSSRADLQSWSVDLNTLSAECGISGYRQVRPQQRRLDVRPLVDEVLRAIDSGREHKWLKPRGEGIDRVQIGKVIPGVGPKETTLKRRKRFWLLLEQRLRERGAVDATDHAPDTVRRSTEPDHSIGPSQGGGAAHPTEVRNRQATN